jgi:hypothetical protein
VRKYLTSDQYKKLNSRRAKRRFRQNLKSKKKKLSLRRTESGFGHIPLTQTRTLITPPLHRIQRSVVYAPADLRVIENPEECLAFFRDLRQEENLRVHRNRRYVVMSLRSVTAIDYASISILTAINDEFKDNRILLQTILPLDPDVSQFMIDAGYLNNLVDDAGNPFPKADKSDLIFFEKGCGILSQADNRRITSLIRNVVRHLTEVEDYSMFLKTIILEICGNSIEWSGTSNKQWLLGAKYEEGSVTFTVTDIGRGIIQTLYRKFTKKFFDALSFNTDAEILKGAFNSKYGSTTQEVNRNKGLPAVKWQYENGGIQKLIVLTNNVILHFDDSVRSIVFRRGAPRFKGTFYQWRVTADCLNRATGNT